MAEAGTNRQALREAVLNSDRGTVLLDERPTLFISRPYKRRGKMYWTPPTSTIRFRCMKKSYEAIFIGCGAIGSAARYRPFRDARVPCSGSNGSVSGTSGARSRSTLASTGSPSTSRSTPPLIGRILRDLAFDGDTRYSIEAFRLEQSAFTDSALEKAFHV